MLMILGTAPDGRQVFSPSDRIMQRAPFDSKKEMELEHLRHFESLVNKQCAELGFSLVSDGADPPDFLIRRGDKVSGLELTMYSPCKRRERVNFFAKLQNKVREIIDSRNIVGLSGIHIELSFGDLGGKPRRISDEVLEALIDAFIELTKKPRGVPPENHDFGFTPYPLGQEGCIEEEGIHWYVCQVSGLPFRGSVLANVTGFELTYTHREWTSNEEIEVQILDCIGVKDQPCTDELLISVGAPDRQGLHILGESQCLMHFMIDWKGLPSPPKYLKRVFLDVWGVEQVFVLYDAEK